MPQGIRRCALQPQHKELRRHSPPKALSDALFDDFHDWQAATSDDAAESDVEEDVSADEERERELQGEDVLVDDVRPLGLVETRGRTAPMTAARDREVRRLFPTVGHLDRQLPPQTLARPAGSSTGLLRTHRSKQVGDDEKVMTMEEEAQGDEKAPLPNPPQPQPQAAPAPNPQPTDAGKPPVDPKANPKPQQPPPNQPPGQPPQASPSSPAAQPPAPAASQPGQQLPPANAPVPAEKQQGGEWITINPPPAEHPKEPPAPVPAAKEVEKKPDEGKPATPVPPATAAPGAAPGTPPQPPAAQPAAAKTAPEAPLDKQTDPQGLNDQTLPPELPQVTSLTPEEVKEAAGEKEKDKGQGAAAPAGADKSPTAENEPEKKESKESGKPSAEKKPAENKDGEKKEPETPPAAAIPAGNKEGTGAAAPTTPPTPATAAPEPPQPPPPGQTAAPTGPAANATKKAAEQADKELAEQVKHTDETLQKASEVPKPPPGLERVGEIKLNGSEHGELPSQTQMASMDLQKWLGKNKIIVDQMNGLIKKKKTVGDEINYTKDLIKKKQDDFDQLNEEEKTLLKTLQKMVTGMVASKQALSVNVDNEIKMTDAQQEKQDQLDTDQAVDKLKKLGYKVEPGGHATQTRPLLITAVCLVVGVGASFFLS
ncbi:unnamed protein product [Vitrella brassicaformis CCMP3155]|uniref:Uncharacterized protein n=1 Tax=Vitrella brassicaformis (strain CCMP3155) TaxID=1169540 RepID=A0A0G4G9C0_VITBC|nr:unnamed protein product [Vitrella brassicaformis CCMP3155]|mmetsp:Transcript_50764/g.127348  ORF Transcript_50764/g.127348 Transcript_50764/m.127348 type:complete len:655 (+) Transcript_50764:308-2272(+)|eukprot:CEM25388.1 unnamed protein product [Vitrella brassicaformis CCMP3155]